MNSRSADFFSSNNIFTYNKEAYEWPLWGDGNSFPTGCCDDQPEDQPFSDWMMLADLPHVGFNCSDRYMNQGISSISGYENSHVDTNQQPALPSWSSIQNSHSPPKSASNSVQQVCRVCNDTASGMHFGIMSCEACKSFFRRSIRAEAKYVCKGNKCCEIDKNSRNKCQHCRMQKCIDVGMKKGAVQEERTPYPIKEHKLSTRRTKSTGSLQQSPTIPRKFSTSIPFPFHSLGPMPVNVSFNDDAKDQATLLEMLKKADKAEISAILNSPTTESHRKFPESTRSLLSVISWAKKIPIFTQLPVDDQIKLIKESWSEVNTLKLVHRIIKFPTGSNGAFKNDESTHLYLTDNPVVASSVQKLIKESTFTMQEIRLDETELSCLKLITLMNPIIRNLTESGQKEIEHAQDTGLKLLETHVQKSKLRPSQRMTKLLLFHGQVKGITKDIAVITYDNQILESEGDAAILKLISQNI